MTAVNGRDFIEPSDTGATPGESNTGGAIVSVEQQPTGMIPIFSLQQNHPNPFDPETTIEYALPADVEVKLTIFNLLDQYVATL